MLKAILDKQIRLVDYEILTDSKGIRIIGFGRWAGLVGTYNGIRALCIRHRLSGLAASAGMSYAERHDETGFAFANYHR